MREPNWNSYATAEAFRNALEHRLGNEAKERGIPVNRLRKEAAFHRLLARFVALGPPRWALKGAFAMIARLGRHVRGTRDVDSNWRASLEELEALLTRVEEVDLEDWFRFEFGEPQEMEGKIPGQIALRYPVTCYLGAREFERMRLDVNLVGADDPRPTEITAVRRNPFAFVGVEALEVPMIPAAHQLAEKLHAYVREYRDGRTSRLKDLYDAVLIAQDVRLPAARSMADATRETFGLRETAWPTTLKTPPATWEQEWTALVDDGAEPVVADMTLEAAFDLWRRFWLPLLRGELNDGATWSPERGTWIEEDGGSSGEADLLTIDGSAGPAAGRGLAPHDELC